MKQHIDANHKNNLNKRKVSLQRNYKLNSAHLKNKFKL